MDGYPRIVQGSLRILGVHRYSDTGSQSYKWISSIQGSLGILGVCGYSVMGGHPWIVRIFRVSLVYMDTQIQGVDHGWTSSDSLG